MLVSMTGFGNCILEDESCKIQTEIRSLNSKGLEINVKIPSAYRGLEADVRNLISQKLIRGKVDVSFNIEDKESGGIQLNEQLLQHLSNKLTKLADNFGLSKPTMGDLVAVPGVLEQSTALNSKLVSKITQSVQNAIESLIKFRENEGETLAQDLKSNLGNISNLLALVNEGKDERITQIRERIILKLTDIKQDATFDQNRLEQEMIYYLEKLDVNEEIVRLQTHLDYFEESMQENEMSKGRKLAFIAQEMGREINTLGSKANNAAMQKHVINMKDELEKIKEQINNVL